MRRTYSAFRHMAERAKEHGSSLDFSLEWLRFNSHGALLESDCCYCHKPLTPKTMSWDHDLPIERGGDFGWSNIQLCCSSCNRAKGTMTGKEFEQFLGYLGFAMPTAVENDILGRMKAGAAVKRLRFLGKKKTA